MPIRPDENLFSAQAEIDRQAEYGRLRAQQRAAAPLITLLREIGVLRESLALIEVRVDGDEAVEIHVSNATLTPRMLAKHRKGA